MIEIVEVTKECLVSIKECDKMNEFTDLEILDIFKKYAISKLVRFEKTKEVVIEFQESGDLEALEIDFDDLKMPKLGEKAFIDCGSEVDSQGFIKQYKLMRKK